MDARCDRDRSASGRKPSPCGGTVFPARPGHRAMKRRGGGRETHGLGLRWMGRCGSAWMRLMVAAGKDAA